MSSDHTRREPAWKEEEADDLYLLCETPLKKKLIRTDGRSSLPEARSAQGLSHTTNQLKEMLLA